MKDRYKHLLSKIKERKPAADKFVEVLHTQTTWLTSPASTKYHMNREGGLFEHSIGVAETLLQMRIALAPEISEESCVIVGLFHDIGRWECQESHIICRKSKMANKLAPTP
jgi:23S rRNA maturation-related 3'-5' exoribonuclease YhaM